MAAVTVNGRRYTVNLPDDTPLLWALRDELGLTGTKFGCGMALCGACTVHVDGQPARACMTPLAAVASSKITTIEAIGADKVGRAVQAAWVDDGRAAMRLLPDRPDHGGDRAAQADQAADRRRDRRGHERQYLPVRHVRAHPGTRSSRSRASREARDERAGRSLGQRERDRRPSRATRWSSPT